MDSSTAPSSSEPLDVLPPPPRARKRDLDSIEPDDDTDDMSFDSDSPWIVEKVRAVPGPGQVEIDKVYTYLL